MAGLDLVKFKKVWALVGQGSTEGEQDSARARAEKMAEKAGMTLAEAVNAMHAPAPGQPINPFAGFDDWMEVKEPGHKARCARQRAEREAARAARRAELITQFGSEVALFANTPLERDLAEATETLVTWKSWTDDDGEEHLYVGDLAGWSDCHGEKEIPPALVIAVTTTVPMPSTLAGAWAELKAADQRREDRRQFDDHHEPSLPIRAREYFLEAMLEANPARSFEDIVARLEWSQFMDGLDLFQYRSTAVLECILEDLKRHDARLRSVSRTAIDAINKLDRDIRDRAIEAATAVMLAEENAR